MIVRTWNGRVPSEHSAGFHKHLLATGVADYRAQPGCVDVDMSLGPVPGSHSMPHVTACPVVTPELTAKAAAERETTATEGALS